MIEAAEIAAKDLPFPTDQLPILRESMQDG